MSVGSHSARHLDTGREGLTMHRHGIMTMTHIIRRIVIGVVTVIRMAPTRLMDVIVVGIEESGGVEPTMEGAIGRHHPAPCGSPVGVAETQHGGSVVHTHAGTVVEPDATQVDGHIDFVAGVGIVAVEPNLIELGVDTFGPYLVDEYVGFNLIGIATIDHQLVLRIEVTDGSFGLRIGKITYRICKKRVRKC